MNKEVEKYLTNIFKEKSLVVMQECISSLKVSIELTEMLNVEKERMLSLLELMLKHLEQIDTNIKLSIDNLE